MADRKITITIPKKKKPKRSGGGSLHRGPIRTERKSEYLSRRRTAKGIRFFDLAQIKIANEWQTREISVGGPLVRSQAPWADLISAINYPTLIPTNLWASHFKQIDDERYNLSYLIELPGGGGLFTQNIETFDDFAFPQFEAPDGISSFEINNLWDYGESDGDHPYYESGLFESLNLATPLFTETLDPLAETVTPAQQLDFTKAMDFYLAPKAVRVTGEYYEGMEPGDGRNLGGFTGLPYGPWVHTVYPDPPIWSYFTGSQTCNVDDYPPVPGVDGTWYAIRADGFIRFVLTPSLPSAPVTVCGLGAALPDNGGYENFSPDLDQFNSPTFFWDREYLFENYFEGDFSDDAEEMNTHLIAAGREQGGDNIKRHEGVWSLSGAERDDMTYARQNFGGSGTLSEPRLIGAVNQGSRWFYGWNY